MSDTFIALSPLIAAGVFLLLFLVSYIRNPARMRVGFLFCLFLVCGGLAFVLYAAQSNHSVPRFLLLLIGFAFLFVLSFGLYVLIASLLLNARVMLKRERRSLSNLLTLFFALALILLLVLSWAAGAGNTPLWLQCLWMGTLLVTLFYFFHIFVYLTSLVLCNLVRPAKKQDYIVVLGASLVNGKPSPLLARRVDRAIRFYHAQGKKRQPPKLVFSGGQGGDEAVSEADAMREYARSQRVPDMDMLVEARSANTYENMLYSKQLMDEDSSGKPYRAIFATSNYHLLRSGMLASKVGLHMRGIGSKTALYYLPTALLREYVAYFWMRRLPLFIIVGLLFLTGVAIPIFNYMMVPYMF